MTRSWTLLFCSLVISTATVECADWPAFRGPHGDGVSHDTGFPVEWSADKNVKWRTPLPGPGNGSPIVVGDRVFVLCAEDQGQKRSTLCFDRKTGQELWRKTVAFHKVEMTHKDNPYCPSTPASDGQRIYVWHRSAGMYCYDLNGNQIWSRELGEFDHIWGGGSSPLLYKDLVIQLCGPGERTFLIALNRTDGDTVWETPIETGGSSGESSRYVGTWATPVLTEIDGKDRLICPYHVRTVTYDPASGKELSTMLGLHREKSDLCYASPVIGNGIAAIQGGFSGPAFAYRLGGTGDTTSTHRLWRSDEEKNPQRIGSGIILDGYLYFANADGPGSLECLNLETGEQTWELRRSEDGPHWASLILADGKLYATGQKGFTVFEADPQEFKQIATNSLGEHCNATPAFSDGELFIRTWDAIYCIAESAK